MNRFRKSFLQKKRLHRGTHGISLIPFVWWRHHASNKGHCFLSVRNARVRVLSFHQFGRPWRKISGLLTTIESFSYFLNFGWERENWRKSEKRGFLDGQKQANMAIFVPRPQVSLTISQNSIIFFLLEDMSVMCLSILTNSVGLKGKELEFFPNW